MSQTCTKCRRPNPADAAYCYFDGVALDGHPRNGGGRPASARTFATPFVFPSGRQCHSFDELALACQSDWSAARTMLDEGLFESFLGALGRADLVLTAREAARFPDRDRGLDRLVAELPTSAVEPPKLCAEPLDLNLGVLTIGEDRRFELHLENRGMRLLYGSATCDDCDWLALGEAPGAPEKLFQFGSETVIPVLVKGKRLRAQVKSLEGRILVESNGGTAVVKVRADVPAKPFPDGVLAGALTPRQAAEKAKAAPKQAAVFFEKGAVAHWYKENGWVYPVQGPSSSGLAAVQQFFEALGLTPPPKVDISERVVSLSGAPGAALRHTLEIKTEEKRPVYAHATSNQPWLEVGRAKLDGRIAIIPLVVPNVPDREGETLSAQVTVQANGNQRFVVPVTLAVGGSFQFEPTPRVVAPPAKPTSRPVKTVAAPEPAPLAALVPEPPLVRSHVRQRNRAWLHALPVAGLVVALLAIAAFDLRRTPPTAGGGPVSVGGFDDAPDLGPLDDPEPLLGIAFERDTFKFGLTMPGVKDPENPDRAKRLTSEPNGKNNNTRVKVDGFDHLFGDPARAVGRWLRPGVRRVRDGRELNVWDAVYRYEGQKVEVTQTVLLVPGAQTRRLDTCLVIYQIANKDTVAHKVGVRVMLDTFIGANDGVPFAVPGLEGLVETKKDFGPKEMPDYIQALENDDPSNPGTVAHVGVKLPGYEEPDRLLICHWPNKNARWDIDPIEAMDRNPAKKDSCVVVYWSYLLMNAGEVRRMAFTYGLSAISTQAGRDGAVVVGDGRLGLTAGGDFRPGKEFTVTAYVKDPKQGQSVRLLLPEGFTFGKGYEEAQTVKGGGAYNQVSWRVRAGGVGKHALEAESAGARALHRVEIREKSIY